MDILNNNYSSHEFAQRGAKDILWALTLAILATDSTIALFQFTVNHNHRPTGALIGIAGTLFMLFLLRRGYIKIASWFIGFVIVAISLVGASGGSGPTSASLVGLPIATIMSSWLLGRRISITLTIFSIAGILVLLAMQLKGHSFVNPSPIPGALMFIVSTLLGLLIGTSASRSFNRQLSQIYELGRQLQRSNLDLEVRIEERTRELSQTVEQLKQTQTGLLEAEKLASLGAMVAGIAHELNTPIGNTLTITTTLQVNVNKISTQMADGNLRKNHLVEFLQDADALLNLATNSISRAADLINNFKQVAVDQTSEIRREFDLAQVVQSNLETLKIEFKKSALRFDNAIPAQIRCNSYPGPLGQIVVNLLRNACLHGFDAGLPGQITIGASVNDGLITLEVSDDGKGMDAATLARIFDPFFTTRLGRGGSGLGLSICKRIATNILGGDLTARLQPGQGSSFVLTFPLDAPGKHLVENKTIIYSSPH